MKVTFEGKPKEIKKLLNAIGGSKEQLIKISSLDGHRLKELSKRYKPTD